MACSSWSWTPCLMSLTVCFSSRVVGVNGGCVFLIDLAFGTPCFCRMMAISDRPNFSAVSSGVSPYLLMTCLLIVPLWFSKAQTICKGSKLMSKCGSKSKLTTL
ncbi:hypothetical protein Hanom_Chr14g01315911 [Helianthus anomalus]